MQEGDTVLTLLVRPWLIAGLVDVANSFCLVATPFIIIPQHLPDEIQSLKC